jgi:hypothetical protein
MIYFLCLLAPVLRAKYDYYQIEVRQTSVNYNLSNSITIAAMLFSGVTLYYFTGASPFKIGFLIWTTCLLVFDYLLNHYRGKAILSYYGNFEDVENLSFIEKHVYMNASWRSLLLTKVTLFIISILIYIK